MQVSHPGTPHVFRAGLSFLHPGVGIPLALAAVHLNNTDTNPQGEVMPQTQQQSLLFAPTSTLPPAFGYALHAIHAAQQRGATFEDILNDLDSPDPAADADMEADQVAHSGSIVARAADVRAAIRLIVTAAALQAAA